MVKGQIIKNKAQLTQVAKEVLRMKPGIIALEGPMGAGKTTFTKVLAKQLGIQENITSPTFVLNVQYTNPKSQIKLEHIDCWRMDEFGELEQIGLQKMIEEKSLVVIEWAEKFQNQISKIKDQKIIWVKIEYGDKINERRISYEDIGH